MSRPFHGWGRSEYVTPAPVWLGIALLLLAGAGAASDISISLHVSRDAPLVLFIPQVALNYLAAGLSLFSMRLSVLLTALAMAATFATHRPIFPIIAIGVVALAGSALSRKTIVLIHVGLSLSWATLITWQSSSFMVPEIQPGTFWWSVLWVLAITCLVGLTLRFLVIRTARTQAKLKEAEARVEQIRREERQDLARELHDVVAHHITVITMQVMARRHSHDPSKLREALEIIDGSAREALTELRALLDLLRSDEDNGPRPLDSQVVTGPSVQDQVDRHIDSLTALGFQVTGVTVDPRIESLPLSTRTTSTRIVQESVTNIIKHARHGASCNISLTLHPTKLEIRITNDRVKALDHDPPQAGYGLTSLNERVQAVGGRYSARRHSDQWVVEASLPVHQTRRSDTSMPLSTRLPTSEERH